MSTLTARSNTIALVGQAIQDGGTPRPHLRGDLLERALPKQRWQRNKSRGANAPIACRSPRTRSVRRNARLFWQWLSRRSSGICAPVKSFPVWPTRELLGL